jgi:hypothetical protein
LTKKHFSSNQAGDFYFFDSARRGEKLVFPPPDQVRNNIVSSFNQAGDFYFFVSARRGKNKFFYPRLSKETALTNIVSSSNQAGDYFF